MEERQLNISFNKSGRGTTSTRITLPIKWVKEMGITEDSKGVDVSFTDGKIIIEKQKEGTNV